MVRGHEGKDFGSSGANDAGQRIRVPLGFLVGRDRERRGYNRGLGYLKLLVGEKEKGRRGFDWGWFLKLLVGAKEKGRRG